MEDSWFKKKESTISVVGMIASEDDSWVQIWVSLGLDRMEFQLTELPLETPGSV